MLDGVSILKEGTGITPLMPKHASLGGALRGPEPGQERVMQSMK